MQDSPIGVVSVRLREFRVKNYRCVNDSGPIEIRRRTVLVGRNESGKTNLLLALQSLNPPGGTKELSFVKDFPRDRRREDFSEELPVVETFWELTDEEQEHLAEVYPRASAVREVGIHRDYGGKRVVALMGLPELELDISVVLESVEKIGRSIRGALRGKDEKTSDSVLSSLRAFSETIEGDRSQIRMWANKVLEAVDNFQESITSAGLQLPEGARSQLGKLRSPISHITGDDQASNLARDFILNQLPVFIYLDEYPRIEGHQDIPALVQRLESGLEDGDERFLKLCKVAGLDPKELNDLLAQDHEQRQQLANRAGAIVTRKIRQLWSDRELKVRFNLDAGHFDTLVSDPNAFYDVEVNLNERSRGLKWFFSFYITFAADTAGGPAENAILLLDEPGLFLHALAQRDLLNHFAGDFTNQIIFTTHSPFMIPTEDLPSIRTVNIDEKTGTTVTNDPTGDRLTLFPLQTALGYDLSQTLFVGERNLVVEGVSDYWYLSSVSDYLREKSSAGLMDGLVLTPAGGAQKVSYMLALLTSQSLRVLVLLDDERRSRDTAEELVKSKLIREENVVFVSEGFREPQDGGADLEDLLTDDIFHRLVVDVYAKELDGNQLQLNEHIPRIVKRYQDAFERLGLSFNKMRPAKLFLRKMAEEPDSVMTPESANRFKRLFDVIEDRLEKQLRRDREPFT